MGQISLPVANRTGLSIHWASSGDSAYNNPNIHTKDYYIRNLISIIYKSYMPFFKLTVFNLNTVPGLYILDSDKTDTMFFDKLDNTNFSIFYLNDSYNLKIPNYIQCYNEKTSDLIEKALPVYNGNTLILRNNNTVVIVVKYFSIIRSGWHKQIRNYEHNLKSKKGSTRYNVYRKKIKRLRKFKNTQNVINMLDKSF